MPVSAEAAPIGLIARLQSAWQQRFQRWVKRRIPPGRSLQLSHHNIFILPSRQGLGFVLVLVLMFLGAVNYETNLGFALVFLLVALFVLSIFYTFRNLSGLELSAVPGGAVFAGEQAEVLVILRRLGSRRYESVQLQFPGSARESADLLEQSELRVPLYLPAPRRGWLRPGRLRVETVFPFGICRAWSLLELEMQCLVFPRPVPCDLDFLLSQQAASGQALLMRGSDDFYSLRDYRPGDPLKHVAWKNYARGQGMLVKEYASAMDQRLWLRWDMFEGLDSEARLSRLCWCVIKLDAAGLEFGLDIPGTRIEPARGPAHYQQLLSVLALYGLAEPAGEAPQ